ncbi:cryptochrome/photolyase family protein [Natronospira bacteriovora]|uniref:Deoxyribodipyrimidine photo-lyase n=1 Tax=Natronospira bacteriovora TaxID=3069753 RepID=A0ABU0W857_9GAMM|nr:deoxyribodipyrimidine photo-lyase [Natronospira sp. AB-CW4]MDQ2070224.1 deoxyribodipyrimidine photo-lyase [Natronospira sp. AB-CW4]
MKTLILWFRRDLRLSDNPALRAAVDVAETVIPVFIHAPEEEGQWAPGEAARWWQHESLASLADRLAESGSRLILRRGSTREVLADLLAETGAEGVYWNRLYEPALVERDRSIKQWLRAEGHEARSFQAALLVEPWAMRTGKGEPYRVFTPFWRAFGKRGSPRSPRRKPGTLRPATNWPRSESLQALGLLPAVRWYPRLASCWQPGEAGAEAALTRFLDRGLSSYHEDRDRPAVDGISRLSPHLHHGELSPFQAWQRVSERLAAQAALTQGGEAWLRELVWREFAHHVLFEFPHTPEAPLYERWADFPWREDHQPLLRAWQRGETGYPIVDAGMRELWHSGFMHNRVRMVAASLLVKNIRAPWLAGARWFWDTLVDADLANNTMGWQWSAGCGADAAPYFRIFNPFTQSRRFDGDGAYIRRWLPELARLPDKALHAPHEAEASLLQAAGVRLGKDYPRPVVDYRESRAAALAAAKQLR